MVGVEGGAVVLLCAANGRDRNGRKARVVWLKDGITLDLRYVETFPCLGCLRNCSIITDIIIMFTITNCCNDILWCKLELARSKQCGSPCCFIGR